MMQIGDIYINKDGEYFKIESYVNSRNVFIRFEGSDAVIKTQKGHIDRGQVSNPFKITLFGKGFIGLPEKSIVSNALYNKAYSLWTGMMERCYSPSFSSKNSAYAGCEVCEDWCNFSNFLSWFSSNYIEGWELDKDILSGGKTGKQYGPENCAFLPTHLNNLFHDNLNRKECGLPLGVGRHHGKYRARLSKKGERVVLGRFNTPEEAFAIYKREKEKYVKQLAEEYKPLIDTRVYTALINWKMED